MSADTYWLGMLLIALTLMLCFVILAAAKIIYDGLTFWAGGTIKIRDRKAETPRPMRGAE
jgi:hypothetical protein